MFHKRRKEAINLVIEKPGLLIRRLSEPLAAAAACTKVYGTVQAEQIAVRNLKRPTQVFELLITNAVREQDRLGIAAEKEGRVRPARSALAELQEKLGISG